MEPQTGNPVNPEMAERLKKYAELKEQEKAIANDIETLKPIIKEWIEGQGVDKVPTSMGTFSLGSRSVWKYSPAVEKLQKEEKATGIAKQVVSTSLIFSAPKLNGELEE